MIDGVVDLLACPRCAGELSERDGTLRCAAGHSHDLARQGYVNLLGGPEPGNADSVAMLQARARVHAAGVFAPVAGLVAGAVQGRSPVLEVGAGTAYYLTAALGADRDAVGLALDVSKAAARIAARADPR
ncbi:putative RNA methyltransferase, partial [Propionicimonas sp.]|uniref:putative RNA methyltransferase n=1 Tax=Propionicimonas sp. TaxID=1955623 RepID=UPI0039E51826